MPRAPWLGKRTEAAGKATDSRKLLTCEDSEGVDVLDGIEQELRAGGWHIA
jgi:hypothetical protein